MSIGHPPDVILAGTFASQNQSTQCQFIEITRLSPGGSVVWPFVLPKSATSSATHASNALSNLMLIKSSLSQNNKTFTFVKTFKGEIDKVQLLMYSSAQNMTTF